MEPTTTLTRAASVRPAVGSDRRLVFYAAIFNVTARVDENGERFTEVIRPGAFARSLGAGVPVYACVGHDQATTFSRTGDGLLLQEDPRGLFASCYLPDSPLGERVARDVAAGRLDGASFKFRDTPGGRVRTGSGDAALHEVRDVELLDVCLAAGNAVYRETVVGLRTAATEPGPVSLADVVATAARLRLLRLRG